MNKAVEGLKKQVFGGVLLGLGLLTAVLARTIGFELDIFYLVISFVGAGIFIYGSIQRARSR